MDHRRTAVLVYRLVCLILGRRLPYHMFGIAANQNPSRCDESCAVFEVSVQLVSDC